MTATPAWLEHVDLGRSALIIVDMQNDFCHENGSSAVNGGDVSLSQAIVPNIQRLIDAMHRAGRPVIFIKTTHDETTNTPSWEARQRNRKVKTCVTGTWGTGYYGVAPVEGDIEVTKHRYSAFIRTELEGKLRALGVETLLMTGVATNGCVESTLRDGFMLDFFVLAVEDGCGCGNPAAQAQTMSNVRKHFGWVTTSTELADLLDRSLTVAA